MLQPLAIKEDRYLVPAKPRTRAKAVSAPSNGAEDVSGPETAPIALECPADASGLARVAIAHACSAINAARGKFEPGTLREMSDRIGPMLARELIPQVETLPAYAECLEGNMVDTSILGRSIGKAFAAAFARSYQATYAEWYVQFNESIKSRRVAPPKPTTEDCVRSSFKSVVDSTKQELLGIKINTLRTTRGVQHISQLGKLDRLASTPLRPVAGPAHAPDRTTRVDPTRAGRRPMTMEERMQYVTGT